MELSQRIEQTLLRPDATLEEMDRFLDNAKEKGFYGVCVPPNRVARAHRVLGESPLVVVTVAGFPFGYDTVEAKVATVKRALSDGASEVDAVLSINDLKSGSDHRVLYELESLREATGERILKIILETALLTPEEQQRAVSLAVKARVDFVKTSTGYASQGATVEVVKRLRKLLGNRGKIKASGGIRTKKEALLLIEAGADRIGTSQGEAMIP